MSSRTPRQGKPRLLKAEFELSMEPARARDEILEYLVSSVEKLQRSNTRVQALSFRSGIFDETIDMQLQVRAGSFAEADSITKSLIGEINSSIRELGNKSHRNSYQSVETSSYLVGA